MHVAALRSDVQPLALERQMAVADSIHARTHRHLPLYTSVHKQLTKPAIE